MNSRRLIGFLPRREKNVTHIVGEVRCASRRNLAAKSLMGQQATKPADDVMSVLHPTAATSRTSHDAGDVRVPDKVHRSKTDSMKSAGVTNWQQQPPLLHVTPFIARFWSTTLCRSTDDHLANSPQFSFCQKSHLRPVSRAVRFLTSD